MNRIYKRLIWDIRLCAVSVTPSPMYRASVIFLSMFFFLRTSNCQSTISQSHVTHIHQIQVVYTIQCPYFAYAFTPLHYSILALTTLVGIALVHYQLKKDFTSASPQIMPNKQLVKRLKLQWRPVYAYFIYP